MLIKSYEFIFQFQNDVILGRKSWDLYILSIEVIEME